MSKDCLDDPKEVLKKQKPSGTLFNIYRILAETYRVNSGEFTVVTESRGSLYIYPHHYLE